MAPGSGENPPLPLLGSNVMNAVLKRFTDNELQLQVMNVTLITFTRCVLACKMLSLLLSAYPILMAANLWW